MSCFAIEFEDLDAYDAKVFYILPSSMDDEFDRLFNSETEYTVFEDAGEDCAYCEEDGGHLRIRVFPSTGDAFDMLVPEEIFDGDVLKEEAADIILGELVEYYEIA